MEIQEILREFKNVSYFDDEWEILLRVDFKELSREEVDDWEVLDDDGNVLDGSQVRIWTGESEDLEFQVLLYNDGKIEIGDEMAGIVEEGSWK